MNSTGHMSPILFLVHIKVFVHHSFSKSFMILAFFTSVENVFFPLPTFNHPSSKEIGESFGGLGEEVPHWKVRDA